MRAQISVCGILLCLCVYPAHATGFDDCRKHFPYGVPQYEEDRNITPICHHGFAIAHDDDHLVPLFVSYVLTGPHTLGCNKRVSKFHADEKLPVDRRSKPADYIRSGYDKGHSAPSADFSWSKAQMFESFSMANMSPQLHGLNAGEWELLEETTRGAAWQLGPIFIMTGPVIPAKPKTIGADEVAIPSGFWKVIVSILKDEALAFVMPQRAFPTKSPLDEWQVKIEDVEHITEIGLPLPKGIEHDAKSSLWNVDLNAWRAAHKNACAN